MLIDNYQKLTRCKLMHPCDHAAAQPSRTKTSSRVTKKDSLGGKLRPQTEGTKAVMAERIKESQLQKLNVHQKKINRVHFLKRGLR